MPSSVHEYLGYRIAIYSPNWHYAVVTPPGSNRVIEFGDERPTASVVEGPDTCLSRAQAVIDGVIKRHKEDGMVGVASGS